ncbi:formylglycine-generating enzyme family protein [Neisseria leonii]|uniref:formylglycine-generating enzyme family protein n=1 Tax=Neisseria leonii TaxID=2995413 RepID=UPI00237B03B7|nr:formylglycine-generating enzyme family protein [Neisseria sp. 3986]MDD9325430.1 formylglycine-generating enzyme family protein [Neisseria sp. 3986]
MALICRIVFVLLSVPAAAYSGAAEMVKLPGGSYRPLYLKENTPQISVRPYRLDKYPVSNREFAAFTAQNPQWRRGHTGSKQSDRHYLAHWVAKGQGFAPKTADLDKPVTYVSWFAAHAYCRAQGKRLPTIDEWEFAGQASQTSPNGAKEAAYRETILNWYAEGSSKGLGKIGRKAPNYWGIHDMHGLIWEWTEDFNSSLLNSGQVDNSMFCSGASAGAADPSDYAAFMRYGFRTSVQAKFSVHNLGFRCAADS